MEISDSMEVRWFLDQPPTSSVRDWFAVAAETRVDRYLCTGRADLSFELRGGCEPALAETKYRLGRLPAVALAATVCGHLERWRKLSISAPDGNPNPGQWLDVEKQRQTRRFAWQALGVIELADGRAPQAGCNVELTQLRVRNLATWTLGLEAVGPAPQLLELLQRTAGHCFALLPELELRAELSAGYAEWLEGRFE